MTQDELIELAKANARFFEVDPALVCAVVEQESGWEPWAIRYEPAFYDRYISVLHLLNPTEAHARAFSWGLMQLMGQVARELGYSGKIAKLLDPEIGLHWGCKHLSNKLRSAAGDVTKALLLWNGGGNQNYPAEVLARLPKYLRYAAPNDGQQ